MLPIRLEIKNFLAYRSPDPLVFEGIHLACLTGSNGAGKSSLLDAITWALWGKARARRDEELVHLGQHDMYVQLDFIQDGAHYRVIRRRTRKTSGQGTLDLLSVAEDGALTTLSGVGIRVTEAKIQEIVRLDYDTFVNSAFIQQGKADAFTTKTAKERKEILARILGLSRWENYETLVKDELKTLSATIQEKQYSIQEIDTDLARETQLRIQLQDAQRAQKEAEHALQEAEVRLAEVEFAPTEYRNATEQKVEIERRLKTFEQDRNQVFQEIAHQEARIAQFQAVIDQQQQIADGFEQLQKARENDHALGDKLMQLQTLEERRHQLERDIATERASLESEIAQKNTQIRSLEKTVQNARQDEYASLLNIIDGLGALQAERLELETHINVMKTEQGALDAENKTLRHEMADIKERMNQLAAVEGTLCPLCGQPLDEHAQARLHEELLKDGTQRGDQFRINQGRQATLKTELETAQARLQVVDGHLNEIREKQQQAAVLKKAIEQANQSALEVTELQAEVTALSEQLAHQLYALPLFAQLDALNEDRESLGYDRVAHDDARDGLSKYRNFEAQQKELEIALVTLPEVQKTRDNHLERQGRLDNAIQEEREHLATSESRIAELKVLATEQQTRYQEVNRLRSAERQASERLISANQELGALDKQRERKENLLQQLKDTKTQQSLYDELRVAFGKNGIPAMMIETAIPELESGANRLLGKMTDGRMQLALTTQREKVSGGMAETLDIQIADELGTRSYDLFSGGEAFRINFALRIALSQMLARRAGAHLRTLFIDEGFGTQDADGRDKLIEAINVIQDDFDLILVITHIEDLRDSFPVHIQIDKTREGSSIQIQ